MTNDLNIRLIKFFAGVAFVLTLLFVSIRVKKPVSREDVKQQNRIEMKAVIDTVLNSLRSFGVDDSLTKKMRPRELKKQNLKAGYTITVPYDVSIPVLINDIENKFLIQAAYISSKETKIGLEYETIITDNAKWKLCFQFIYNKELRRRRFILAPVVEIKNIATDSLPVDFLEKFAGGTFILPLTKASEKVAARIDNAHCNYIIDISEKSDAQEYKLDATFTKKRLNESLGEIAKSFPSARFYYSRTNSPTYNSVIFPYIKTVMKKHRIGSVTEKNFKYIRSEKNEKIADSLCAGYVIQASKAKSSILLSGYNQTGILKNIVFRAERLGAIVVPVDSVLRKQLER